MIRALMNVGIEGTYLTIIKAIYDKPIVNIIKNGERLKQFPVKSRMRQWCFLSPCFFNIVLELLARAIKQEEDIKEFQIRKKAVKLSLLQKT
jgi:hypothetical protein